MARRKGHDAQVDPFTAGEPTLPWDEPGSFEEVFSLDGNEAEPCAFEEGPYDGPTKDPDAYDAPSSKATEEDRGSDPDDEVRPSRVDEARERKRLERAERAAERRARKAAPQDKQARPRVARFVRAILFIVIFVNLLPFALDIADRVVSGIASSTDPEPQPPFEGPEAPSIDADEIEPEIDRSALDEDELACVEACDSYLQAVAGGQDPQRADVIAVLEQNMEDSVGYSCEDLGIDSNAYADWVLSNFSYRITSCYAWADEGSASVYLYAWAPDTFGAIASASQSIFNYLDELGIDNSSSMRPLTEEERGRVRSLFAETIENAEMDSESFLGFDLTLEDGAWTLDIDQAQYQLGIPLGY